MCCVIRAMKLIVIDDEFDPLRSRANDILRIRDLFSYHNLLYQCLKTHIQNRVAGKLEKSFNSCVVIFSRNSCVVFWQFFAKVGTTTNMSIHDLSKK